MDKELTAYINENFSLQVEENNYGQLKKLLAEKVNHLINTDFTQLIQLLYRVDVNELKLKRLLKEHGATDAAEIIASLIIERQLQKINSRRQHRNDSNFNEEEKW